MADPDYSDEEYMMFLQGLPYVENEEDDDAVHRFLEEQEGSERESEATDEDYEDGDVDYIPVEDSPVRGETGNPASTSDRTRLGESEGYNKRRRQEEVEAVAGSSATQFASQGSQWNRGEIDGLFCPICMEAWTSDGDHHICCLPCGHTYGMSCINRWLQQQKKNARKCPQCNRHCTLKDVRKLFASRIVTVDEESQKRIRQLEATCAGLEKKDAGWRKKEFEWKNKETESGKRIEKLEQKICQLKERTICLERLMGEEQTRLTGSAAAGCGGQGHSASGGDIGLGSSLKRSPCSFEQLMEFPVEGAWLFDVSASYQMLLVSRRLHGMAGRDVLTKISPMYPRESEDIALPSNTKAVKDLHISPSDGDIVLFASLGKSLAVLSMESNNIVLAYDLPAAAWSCSWDYLRPHYVYAGLQNGTFMVFDMRQTVEAVESLDGLSSNPIHTIYPLSPNSTGFRGILTASSIGLCLWNVNFPQERPILVPETANEGVCISLACSPNTNNIVATYRPKIEMCAEMTLTQQPSVNPSPISGQVVQGSHVFFQRASPSDSLRKVGSVHANVSDIRLPRTAIITENRDMFFASGDEATNELALQKLPPFSASQRFKLRKHPLRNIKYTVSVERGMLTCLSDDVFQVFSSGDR